MDVPLHENILTVGLGKDWCPDISYSETVFLVVFYYGQYNGTSIISASPPVQLYIH